MKLNPFPSNDGNTVTQKDSLEKMWENENIDWLVVNHENISLQKRLQIHVK